MQLSSLALTVVLTFAGSQIAASRNDAAVIRDCRVTLIVDLQVPANLPAQESGVLTALEVSEGMSVEAGRVLAQVDIRMASKQRDVAAAQLEVAILEADNEISVDFARLASLKARNDLEKAEETNRLAPGAIPEVEINGFALAYDQSLAQIKQSQHELAIAQISVTVRQAQLALADQEIERRTIKAPIDGVIQEIFPQVGEWLRPGDPIMRIVGMKRLMVKGYAYANRLQPAQVQGRNVQIQVLDADDRVLDTFAGKIVFVSQLIETGGRFEVCADVENRQSRDGGFWSLRPGMNANIIIQDK